jgi:hypothetical protein
MPADTYVAVPDALERLSASPELRNFIVPYKIEGKLTIRATDAEGAQYLADHVPLSHLAMMGELEMSDPEAVQ